MILTLLACSVHVHVRHEHYHRRSFGNSTNMADTPLEYGVERALKCDTILLCSNTVSFPIMLIGSLC